MLKEISMKFLDAGERRIGESVDWARHMLETSLPATWKYFLFLPFNSHGSGAKAEAVAIARLISVAQEDCGGCVQIEINLAKKARLDPEILRLTLAKDYRALPRNLELIARFTQSVLEDEASAGEFRERVRAEFGEKILLEISLAMATAKFHPIAKRALGFAKACALEDYAY